MNRRILIVAALATGIGVGIALAPGHRGWFDIRVYHDAMVAWVRGHGDLYAYARPGWNLGFTYPPFAAVCMAPMAFLPFYPTIVLNFAATVAASVFVLSVLLGPIVRKRNWRPRWYAYGLAACLFAALDPVRDTFSFGQVNLILLALVLADLVLVERGRPAGIGIGLAAAIKLTPGVFVVYLLLSGRRRDALRAGGTAAGATLLAAVVAPNATSTFFLHAMWDTGRVGTLDNVSNQSLLGLVARLDPAHPDRLLWVLLALAATGLWVWRVRASAADPRTGFALAGLAGCLLSPVTWVHHLVWTIPALVLLADSALPVRRTSGFTAAHRRRTAGAVTVYLLLCSGIVWLWPQPTGGLIGFLGGNAYVFTSLALLAFLPPARPEAPVPGGLLSRVGGRPASPVPAGPMPGTATRPELSRPVRFGSVHRSVPPAAGPTDARRSAAS
jgi:alpha-1,2-mannosyltransferase